MLVLDQLLVGLWEVCAAFPDKRKSEGVYTMADIGLSAFSLFFMQSESFLSYQRSLEEGRKTSNCPSTRIARSALRVACRATCRL